MINDLVGWLGVLGPARARCRGERSTCLGTRARSRLTIGFVGVRSSSRARRCSTAPRRVRSERAIAVRGGSCRSSSCSRSSAQRHAARSASTPSSAASSSGSRRGIAPHLKERTRVIVARLRDEHLRAGVLRLARAPNRLRRTSFDLRLCVLVFVIASAGEGRSGAPSDHAPGGCEWRQAAAVGFGLNARGAMEIILALLALEAGLIESRSSSRSSSWRSARRSSAAP